jgi:hypothetical protein
MSQRTKFFPRPQRALSTVCADNRLLLGPLLALPLLLAAGPSHAQSDQRARRIELSYFGESAKNPGARLGYEAAFYYRQPHELIGGAHVGGYSTPDQAAYSLFFYIEGGYRLNFAVGFFLEARIGLGYTNSTQKGSTQANSDGTSTLGVDVSSNYLMPIGLAGLGFNLMPKFKLPLSLFAQAGGMGRYNQGEPFSGGLVITSGIAYQLGTGRPSHAEPSVPSPPPAVAPPLESYDLPPGVVPQPVPAGPAEQAPPTSVPRPSPSLPNQPPPPPSEPVVPQTEPFVPPPPLPPHVEPPSLPPPPTVPLQ